MSFPHRQENQWRKRVQPQNRQLGNAEIGPEGLRFVEHLQMGASNIAENYSKLSDLSYSHRVSSTFTVCLPHGILQIGLTAEQGKYDMKKCTQIDMAWININYVIPF